MRCHYEHIKGVGKVLIPGCTAVAISGDIRDCTCHCEPQTFAAFERQEYNKEVKRLKEKLSFVPPCPRLYYNEQVTAMEQYLRVLERRAKLEAIDLSDMQ